MNMIETESLVVRTPGIGAYLVRAVFLCRIPGLRWLIITIYAYFFNAKYYGHNAASFDSLLSFFLRTRLDLAAKKRGLNLEDQGVSPAEGVVTFLGDLTHNDTMPIKGAGFTVSKLLGREAPEFERGAVFYLSPGNYHHVHSPADIEITQYLEIPGRLDRVSPSMLKKNPMVYSENLRHVLIGKTQKGSDIAIVLVGAKNVGSILCPKFSGWEYGQTVSYSKGEPLGYFSLGSTVVVLLGSGARWKSCEQGQAIDVMDTLFDEQT